MISQPDRAWCPRCREQRWSYQTTDDGDCKECETAVVDDWPLRARVLRRVKQAIAASIAIAIFLGPPAWAVWRAVTYEGPLYATRTVTTTRVEHYGMVPAVGALLISWLILVLVLVMMPLAPRRI